MKCLMDIIHVLLMSVQVTGIAILSKTVSLDGVSCQVVSAQSTLVSVFGERRDNQRSIVAKISRLLWVEVCEAECWGSVHIMQGGMVWQS